MTSRKASPLSSSCTPSNRGPKLSLSCMSCMHCLRYFFKQPSSSSFSSSYSWTLIWKKTLKGRLSCCFLPADLGS
ncbi:hypothetical protein EYF80_060515 [Liparis tanakae]|uniref:Uncharacterized protein n=1 Tax=Liparis tanakae TaxID=230148 RepID=A0A4Z2EKE9_9TELE|nr:hypothetical protein EYF80_060515 [Liparis tanakae]